MTDVVAGSAETDASFAFVVSFEEALPLSVVLSSSLSTTLSLPFPFVTSVILSLSISCSFSLFFPFPLSFSLSFFRNNLDGTLIVDDRRLAALPPFATSAFPKPTLTVLVMVCVIRDIGDAEDSGIALACLSPCSPALAPTSPGNKGEIERRWNVYG
jgi:hypothetical protein